MQFDQLKRREFITLLGGAAASSVWPTAARAQQRERMRRIGVLMTLGEDDPEAQARLTAFRQTLQQLGWTEDRNIHIEARLSGGSAAETHKNAAELVALEPDVIVTSGGVGLPALLESTRTVPIIFALVPDPVGSGFVESLAHPGGNATGFTMFEYSLAAKWPELLKQIAPSVTRAAVLRDSTITVGIGQFAVIQSVAPSVGIDVTPVNIRNAPEIERAIANFARSANGGLILTASPLSAIHRNLIISLAARYKLPAIYDERFFVLAGGLISYGPNFVDQFRQTAGYVDRILKGAKPTDLPVQAPTKYELAINLKTAKALGLNVPPTLLARADEVIE